MRHTILIAGALIAACSPVRGHSGSGGALAAQGRPRVESSSTDSHLNVLDAYLRSRRQWFQATPAVRICWPVRDSLRIDEIVAHRLITGGGASRVDPTCRDRGFARDNPKSVLNIFEVRIARDTAHVLAGQGVGACLGLEERAVLTRAVVLGKTPDPDQPAESWIVRELLLRAAPGGDCVVITPGDREM